MPRRSVDTRRLRRLSSTLAWGETRVLKAFISLIIGSEEGFNGSPAGYQKVGIEWYTLWGVRVYGLGLMLGV